MSYRQSHCGVLDLLIADGIAPASLYKRKAENEDPEADDQARWETIQVGPFTLTHGFLIEQIASDPRILSHY